MELATELKRLRKQFLEETSQLTEVKEAGDRADDSADKTGSGEEEAVSNLVKGEGGSWGQV